MPFAQGSRSRLSYINEVTFGTTPAGNLIQLPIVTHDLKLTKDRLQSDTIQGDRMTRHDRHGNRNATGDINFELVAGDFDDILASAMFNAWDSTPAAAPDELRVGTTFRSMTIEDYAADIDQARLFTGMCVSQLSFSLRVNQTVKCTASFVGSDMSTSTTEKTITAASTNAPMDAYSGDLQVGDNGGALTSIATITAIDFSINNSLAPTFVIGSAATPQLEYGNAQVEGTITAYYEDQALINRFLNEVETEIFVTVNDNTGSNEYGFRFPRVKLNDGNAPLENPQSRMITIPFVALYDSTEQSNLVIYRPDST